MSLLPRRGKCIGCGHDHGDGNGSPREQKLKGQIDELYERISELAARPNLQVTDLTILVGKLAHALRKAAPDHVLPNQVLDYLRRNGLAPSPLRDADIAELPHQKESSLGITCGKVEIYGKPSAPDELA